MIQFYKPNISLETIRESLHSAISTGQVTNFGKEMRHLEDLLSNYLERPCCLVASGTHALTFSLLALAAQDKIPKKAKVLVPSFTFFASIHSILWAGMEPVFCDIYPDTFTLDISTAQESYDCIMPVNVFGVQHNLDAINSRSNALCVGDLSHGFGGYRYSEKIGTTEHVACFSTSITKPFQTVEGGLIAADKDIIEWIKVFRNWGNPGDYDCTIVGQWSKFTEINAIIGAESFQKIDLSVKIKNSIASKYKYYLEDSVEYQHVPNNTISTFKDFSILLKNEQQRDKVYMALKENSVDSKKYFYPPVHKMKCFEDTYGLMSLPITEGISRRILCLPMHDFLSDEDISLIASIIKRSL